MRLVKVGLVLLVISHCVLAATIRVPQDQATIQAGIDAAVDGDTVLVGPGVYTENLRFDGKAAVVLSSTGSETTIISSSTPGLPVVRFIDSEDTTSVLDGFTIRDATNAHGIRIESSSPVIQNCVITNCSWDGDGGAISFVWSAAKLRYNRIHGNYGTNTGGGIGGGGALPSFLEIIGNEIYDNHCAHGVGIGSPPGGLRARIERNIIRDNTGTAEAAAGIYINNCVDCQIVNNTIVRNTKGIAIYGGAANVQNNILAQNQLEAFYPYAVGDYNDVWANGSVNSPGPNGISSDPRFMNSDSSDFRLQSDSPCIDRGNPSASYNDPDGSRNDIGAMAYEPTVGRIRYVPSEYPTIQAAIDSAVNGDTVLVDEGVYYERLNLLGKRVVVASEYLIDGDSIHIEQTVIDGDTAIVPTIADTASVFRFVQGEDSSTVVTGFTIRNGGDYGVLSKAAGFTLRRCLMDGTGIRVFGDFPDWVDVVLDECQVHDREIMVDSPGLLLIRGSKIFCPVSSSLSYTRYTKLQLESSSVVSVNLGSNDDLVTFSSTVQGQITAVDGSFQRIESSVVSGLLQTGAGGIVIVDSSQIGGLLVSQESRVYSIWSMINGEVVSIAPANFVEILDFRHTTLVGDITRVDGRLSNLVLDSCNMVLNSPLEFDSRWKNVYIHCSNIYAGGELWFTGFPDSTSEFDTLGVFSLLPIFCDEENGIYTIRNSSPCAPANNSCGVLIGAYGVGCENAPPVLTSESDLTIVKRVPFTYIATSEDSDGPSASYSFMNLPSWLDSADDSCFGTPQLDDSDTSFAIVVSDGFLADTMVVTLHLLETPVVAGIAVDGESEPLHVVSAAPLIAWDYSDTTGLYPQTAFEIAVGTDNDWQYAEMWNPAPVVSADTFVVYGGAPLIDGQTYWLRLRVSNSLGWSNWAELMFRMNSVPSIPQLVAPANGGIVTSPQPSLTIRRVPDAEGDSLLLTFEVTNDSSFAFFVPFTAQPGSDSLTTVNVPFYLTEDQHYWWRVKASDYYEESAYSAIWSFWLNGENIAPTHFDLLSPPDGLTPALTTTMPNLQWTRSRDFDPFDSVRYELHIALYPNFSFATIIAGITDTTYQIGEPLSWGTNYWWKVKATDVSTGVTWSNQVFSFRVMKIGDPDGNGQISISDAVFLINYIFAGGPAPVPLLSGDADCSGAISISDAVYLINYIFAAGPAPCEP
ncbi:MAG: right-handed parallel beta-helix repeat-containing protein [candidate division Zixibacteria bacterium]|nr:right-handed parallel beta-helix repeat-containing protein [candidate division Zixibacteria bacterium]